MAGLEMYPRSPVLPFHLPYVMCVVRNCRPRAKSLPGIFIFFLHGDCKSRTLLLIHPHSHRQLRNIANKYSKLLSQKTGLPVEIWIPPLLRNS